MNQSQYRDGQMLDAVIHAIECDHVCHECRHPISDEDWEAIVDGECNGIECTRCGACLCTREIEENW